jgi:ABC-2 type transport system ATP-binding protein
MQRRIRSFIASYNQRYGATVMLTSHYMADVEALCRRVIVIHHGRVLYDGPLSGLVDRFATYRQISLSLSEPADLSTYGEVVANAGTRVTLRVPKAEISLLSARLLAEQSIADLTIEEPPIDDVIERVFATE